MITALVSPADPLLPIRPVHCDETSQRAAHALIGGPTEQIAFIRPDATLHVHADGEAHGLPRNDRATLLVWIHAPDRRGYDVVAGDAYLAGPARHGVDTNTPAEFVAVLTGAAPVLAQTRSHRQPTRASAAETVNTAYGEPFDTYATALLALEQPDTREVRVIPAGEA